MVDGAGIRFGLANGALVLTLLMAGALPLDLAETACVALVAAAVAAATMRWYVALALGVEAWAFFTGFFENRYGVLTFAPHDLVNLGGFVVATAVLAHLLRHRLTAVSGPAR
jgi:hypothetical protein